MLALVESGDLIAVARKVAPDHGFDADQTDWVTMSRWVGGYPTLLLTAVVGMAAIDSGRFRPRWSWPDGTVLVGQDGSFLPLHQLADEVLRPKGRSDVPAIVELGMALGELGIDVTEPLWLTRGSGGSAQTERPTGSFVAYQRFGSRQVIVTDRAIHIFGRPWSEGMRDHYASRMRGADQLRTRMLRVWQGDETDQTAYLLDADVSKARFSVLTGGSRWRLVLHGRDEKVTLRGFGDGRIEEEQVATLLGDRLRTSWLHSPRELFAVRNMIGRVGLALGGPALLAALVLAVLDPVGWHAATAPFVASCGVLALVVALLPDVVMEVVWKIRGPAQRPEPLVAARRYARSAVFRPSAPPPAPAPVSDLRGAAGLRRWSPSPWTSATWTTSRTGRTTSSTSTTCPTCPTGRRRWRSADRGRHLLSYAGTQPGAVRTARRASRRRTTPAAAGWPASTPPRTSVIPSACDPAEHLAGDDHAESGADDGVEEADQRDRTRRHRGQTAEPAVVRQAGADHREPREAGQRGASTAGGAPSTRSPIGRRSSPPATSCHETSVSMSTGAGHRLMSTKPNAETRTEPSAAARPSMLTWPGERSTSRPTPTRPTTAAPIRIAPGRSPRAGSAIAMTASGEAACTVAASPPGSW